MLGCWICALGHTHSRLYACNINLINIIWEIATFDCSLENVEEQFRLWHDVSAWETRLMMEKFRWNIYTCMLDLNLEIVAIMFNASRWLSLWLLLDVSLTAYIWSRELFDFAIVCRSTGMRRREKIRAATVLYTPPNLCPYFLHLVSKTPASKVVAVDQVACAMSSLRDMKHLFFQLGHGNRRRGWRREGTAR